MTSEFSTRKVSVDGLVQEVRTFRTAGYRLVQIGATRLADEVELTYSFDKDTRIEHLRVSLPVAGAASGAQGSAGPALPSISSIYWCAFLYENELHDLFGVQVDGLAVDFHGSLYKTSIKFPFGSTKPPGLKPVVTTTPRSTTPAAKSNNVLKLGAVPTNGSASPEGPLPSAATN